MAEIVIKKTVQINVKEFLDACHLVELIQIQQEINDRVEKKKHEEKHMSLRWLENLISYHIGC